MTITMTGKTIGENIKLARLQAGISRAKLAEEIGRASCRERV